LVPNNELIDMTDITNPSNYNSNMELNSPVNVEKKLEDFFYSQDTNGESENQD
jgi:hypothetical protein